MKDFWDERYGRDEYAYGKEPNQFFEHAIKELQPFGSILFPADGEGRNSVYAATLGLEVTSFDISDAAKAKAIKLADEFGVSIDYRVGNLNQLNLEPESFDFIALIYAHFETYIKVSYHKEILKFLKPGGFVIFEAFSKSHVKFQKINPSAGGPKNPDMLFSKEEVETLFSELETISLNEKVIDLDEGEFHKGKASVIRSIGHKA